MQLDKSRVQGFVTAAGSVNSHTAILARTIGIPAVVSTGSSIGEEYDGKLVAVDGYTGEVFVDPDEATLERIKAKMEQDAQHKKLLEELKGKKSITGGGQQVHVYANIGGTGDLASVLANDAEGIGLFRSGMSLYLEAREVSEASTTRRKPLSVALLIWAISGACRSTALTMSAMALSASLQFCLIAVGMDIFCL